MDESSEERLEAVSLEMFLDYSFFSIHADNQVLDDVFALIEADSQLLDDFLAMFQADFLMFLGDVANDANAPKMMKAAGKTTGVLEKIKIDESETSLVTCLVCIEDFPIRREVRRLPCSHIYHTGCIVKWQHPGVPCCRQKRSLAISKTLRRPTEPMR